MSVVLRTTPLHALHCELGARMVPFAGWDMPLHYGSQLEEHQRTRAAASVFDVSHMLAIDVTGRDARAYLRQLLANDVAKLDVPGSGLYSCMLNADGGVLDDLIVYFMSPSRYRVVVNAGTADSDLAWMSAQRQESASDCTLTPRRELALLAVQGPQARERCHAAWPDSRIASGLDRFRAAGDDALWIARTGYTGEDGYEVMLPAAMAADCWRALLAAGVTPAGLGARDTLRLEAGLNLYGQDMDASVTPDECGLSWTVARAGGREFIGRAALEARTPRYRALGLVSSDRGVMRAHQTVHSEHGAGTVTSGGFAPTLNTSIALARVPPACAAGDLAEVEVRDRRLKCRFVQPPFVREGRARVSV